MRLTFATEPSSPLERALREELGRAWGTEGAPGLSLPGAPPLFAVLYDALEGEVISASTSAGASTGSRAERYRGLRAEVRVGGWSGDSSNFSAIGEPDGVVQFSLPVEDGLALRRRVWLATDSAYKSSVEQFSRKQAARAARRDPRPPDYAPAPAVCVEAAALPPTPPVDLGWLQGLCARLSGRLRDVPGVEEAACSAREWQGRRLTVSACGERDPGAELPATALWRNTGFVVIRVKAAARLPDGSRYWDARSWVARGRASLPPEAEMIAAVDALARQLAGLAEAPAEEDYLGPVLFEGSAAVELFSQLLPPEMIGSPPAEQPPDQSGARQPSARIGRRLLPPGWSVVDDPTDPRPLVGAYSFDMEGVAPRPVQVVEDGVVRDLLMSRMPSRERPHSTGHGRSIGEERRAAMPAVVTVTPPRPKGAAALRRQALRLARQVGHGYVLVIRALEPPPLVESLDFAISGDAPLPGLTRPTAVYRLYPDGREVLVRPMEFVSVDRRVLRDIYAAGPTVGPIDLLDGPPGADRMRIGPVGGLGVTWSVPEVLVTELELAVRSGGEARAIPIDP